jgi:hypothetical protein
MIGHLFTQDAQAVELVARSILDVAPNGVPDFVRGIAVLKTPSANVNV